MLFTTRRIVVNLEVRIHILCTLFRKLNEKTSISLSVGSPRMFRLH